jgi:CheY-like chemotaxis protein
MHISATKILVVEDSERFRRFIVSTLQRSGNFQITEASNGVEALQKAEELLPDLALLDIGLPDLNGIEIARRLQRLAVPPKVVFVSQECSPDIVGEVLSVGALGYVHKMHASRDLLPAIGAVLEGRRFVSESLEIPRFVEVASARGNHTHDVLFYSSDAGFLEGLSDFIVHDLGVGKTTIVVAIPSHREGLIQSLKARGLDIDGAIRRGTYIESDSANTLSTMLVNGVPDRKQLFEKVGGLIEAARTRRGCRGVSACGEVAPLLLAKGQAEAAIQVEQLWDDVIRMNGVDLLCAYPLSIFPGGQEGQIFRSVCAEHSAVYFR